MALCQLNREIEKRSNKRPQLADLRESGAIEQDADVVIFLHTEGENQETHVAGIELNVAKHRNGPTGRMNLVFLRNFQQFKNAEK